MSREYHINVSQSDIENSHYCLICGDPARVPKISTNLNDSREISFNREYRVHLGYLNDSPVIVSSMGIGCPSTAIGIEEFGKLGVDTFLRVGTSGILSKRVKIGHIVSAIGAIRDEGTSKEYVPCAFPAVATPDIVIAIREAVKNLNLLSIFHEGIIHSKDAFYTEIPSMIPNQERATNKWKIWISSGALVTEMESSTLFVICQIRGWRAGGVMAAIGDTEDGKLVIDHERGQKEAINVAVEAIRLLT